MFKLEKTNSVSNIPFVNGIFAGLKGSRTLGNLIKIRHELEGKLHSNNIFESLYKVKDLILYAESELSIIENQISELQAHPRKNKIAIAEKQTKKQLLTIAKNTYLQQEKELQRIRNFQLSERHVFRVATMFLIGSFVDHAMNKKQAEKMDIYQNLREALKTHNPIFCYKNRVISLAEIQKLTNDLSKFDKKTAELISLAMSKKTYDNIEKACNICFVKAEKIWKNLKTESKQEIQLQEKEKTAVLENQISKLEGIFESNLDNSTIQNDYEGIYNFCTDIRFYIQYRTDNMTARANSILKRYNLDSVDHAINYINDILDQYTSYIND